MTIDTKILDFRKGGKFYNGSNPGYTDDDIHEAIINAVKHEKGKLKPQYKNAGLMVTVKRGYPGPNDTQVLVQIKSIVKGLSTPEELYK